jgi:hypothetical protein
VKSAWLTEYIQEYLDGREPGINPRCSAIDADLSPCIKKFLEFFM